MAALQASIDRTKPEKAPTPKKKAAAPKKKTVSRVKKEA
jgi:hypothetical protein